MTPFRTEGSRGDVVAFFEVETQQTGLLGFQRRDQSGLGVTDLDDGLSADGDQGLNGVGALGGIGGGQLAGLRGEGSGWSASARAGHRTGLLGDCWFGSLLISV